MPRAASPLMVLRETLAQVQGTLSTVSAVQDKLAVHRRTLETIQEDLRAMITQALEGPSAPTTDLEALWERMREYWQGDMGPAFIRVEDIEHLFKPGK